MTTTTPTVDNFAARKAKLENALNACGMSSQQIEAYHKAVSTALGAYIAQVVAKANSQAIYDITTNHPTGIVRTLGPARATEVVQHAAVHALSHVIEWGLDEAKALAVELLHDVNYHDAAEHLEKFDA